MRGGILGIDAGGTFTDLVFLDAREMKVVARAKIPTDHENLSSTIEEGIRQILRDLDAGQINGVHLASTLATNATVEKKLCPVGLLLIGYDSGDVDSAISGKRFGEVAVAAIPGGHDIKGNEARPLDGRLVTESCRKLLADGAEGLAISGYFSVRNPAHEIRARRLANEAFPGIFVTCGHELASELNAYKRAATASVNAGLIPVMTRLLDAVKVVLKRLRIDAPLSVIKGDGALVSSDWAALHPVETVVSGPAASAMGACFLGRPALNDRASWVVDIGGTTTDVIGLDKAGAPLLCENGADIGGHRLLVRTIDIRTFGLGGDSHVSIKAGGGLSIGPRRVIPLAVAAEADERVLDVLCRMEKARVAGEPIVILRGRGASAQSALDEALIGITGAGPADLASLTEGLPLGTALAVVRDAEKYEDRGIFAISAFTPTDALHAGGLLDKWCAEASLIAARIYAGILGYPDARAFCADISRRVSALAAGEVFRKAAAWCGAKSQEGMDGALFEAALTRPENPVTPSVSLQLNANLIGVGAPSWAFLGECGRLLGESAVLPRDASVAGAIGAAVGTFFIQHNVLIIPLKTGEYRVHLPDEICDEADLEAAVRRCVETMIPWLERRAAEAGGAGGPVEWERRDEIARISGGTREILLWSRILFTVRDRGDL